MQTRGPARYRAALAVATLSGAAALAHQLLWMRRMVDLVGATPAATTRVLGAFFLGLSLGAALATPIARRAGRPWRLLGIVEAGIAILTVPLLVLPVWSDWLWPALGPEWLAGWPGAILRLLLPVLLVVPPAALMGMTLPLLARAALTGSRTLGREGSWLYALNTAGGVLGLVATTGLSVWGLGIGDAMTAALAVNALLAGVAFVLDRRSGAEGEDQAPATPPPAAGAVAGPFAVAFLSGVCVLAAEGLAVHLFDQVVSLAMLGAAVVLVAVILPLALAAVTGAWLGARCDSVRPVLAAVLALACLTALATPLLFVWQSDGMRYLTLEFSASVPIFLGRALQLGLIAFAPFVFVAGLVLPLTFRWLELAAADPHGRRWGALLAVNGAGGLLGIEVANRVVMPALGMHLGFAAVGIFYGAAAVAVVASDRRRRWRVAGVGGLLVAVVAVAVPRLGALPLVRVDTWPGAHESGSRLVELATGAEGTVAVVDFGPDRVILLENQYVVGGTRAFIRQQRMALLPAVLHPDPRRVAFIGLGTGITAGAALVDPAVESATAIEISPLVADMSRRYFEAFGDDPRGRVVLGDARIAIAAARERYDLVVGDLFMPWQVGTGRLYSVEHFRAVRRALTPGGEFCQWLPMFQLTPAEFHVIVASFRDAFPTAYLFRDDLSPETPAFALVGFRDAVLDWDVVARRAAVLRQTGRTRDGFVAFPNLVRALYLGVADGVLPPDRVRNTLDNGWIERQAALAQVGRRWPYLDVDTQSTLPEYLGDVVSR